MSDQLVLDLWAPVRQEFVDRHQIGQIRLPWDTAGGNKAGDLIPAWRCCACGGIEVNRYHLDRQHNCCEHTFLPYCQNRPGAGHDPYRMDAHWIPPAYTEHIGEQLLTAIGADLTEVA